ncbi:MAG: hypothetical protein VXW18_01640 [Pseudomonadota bacterium]|nr:hypothetical protein [Pseudomonadota bacterium]
MTETDILRLLSPPNKQFHCETRHSDRDDGQRGMHGCDRSQNMHSVIGDDGEGRQKDRRNHKHPHDHASLAGGTAFWGLFRQGEHGFPVVTLKLAGRAGADQPTRYTKAMPE